MRAPVTRQHRSVRQRLPASRARHRIVALRGKADNAPDMAPYPAMPHELQQPHCSPPCPTVDTTNPAMHTCAAVMRTQAHVSSATHADALKTHCGAAYPRSDARLGHQHQTKARTACPPTNSPLPIFHMANSAQAPNGSPHVRRPSHVLPRRRGHAWRQHAVPRWRRRHPWRRHPSVPWRRRHSGRRRHPRRAAVPWRRHARRRHPAVPWRGRHVRGVAAWRSVTLGHGKRVAQVDARASKHYHAQGIGTATPSTHEPCPLHALMVHQGRQSWNHDCGN